MSDRGRPEVHGERTGARDDGAVLADTLAVAIGAMLGQVRAALVGLRSDAAPRPRQLDSTANVLARIEQLHERIAAVPEPGDQEEWAIERLRTRAEWLWALSDPSTRSGGSEQVIHGDYQDSNLFFEQGHVSSVIDWGKAEVRPPAEEVVRALHLSLRLDPAMCGAFLDRCRSQAPVTDEQLRHAAASYCRRRAYDLWVYETIYLAGDDRPRRFLTPGPFVPFDEQWAPLQEALSI